MTFGKICNHYVISFLQILIMSSNETNEEVNNVPVETSTSSSIDTGSPILSCFFSLQSLSLTFLFSYLHSFPSCIVIKNKTLKYCMTFKEYDNTNVNIKSN